MKRNAGVGKLCILLPLLLAAYLVVVFALADHMKSKPFLEKLGYIPSVSTMKVLAADQKQFVGSSLMLKVLMYYGGLVDKGKGSLDIPADYPAMSRTIDAALKLDPFNMDGYYFAQATLTWDVGRADIVNGFLEYGMKYRTWDWTLPFYAGFNYAYFLKDYEKAAQHYRTAAAISGNDMFMNLAGRYMQRSGKTEMAIAYLGMMAKSVRQDSLKKSLETRRSAFLEVLKIEKARDAYLQQKGRLPGSVEDLLRAGLLRAIPRDPYGGTFFLQQDGSVSSTSGFSFIGDKK
jgi:tetratricopeptide (TPR) repeat protein